MTTKLELFNPLPQPWSPHAYQKRAAKFLIEHACGALFLDPGLGKSSITLAAIKILMKKKVLRKTLVIAPLRVCHSVWPAEVEKWEDFGELRVEVLHGPKKDEALARDADIYVINPEGLEWLLQVKKTKVTSARTGKTTTHFTVDLRRFKKLGFDLLVIDELTKFKHQGSGRFKMLKMVHKLFGRRWGLTGSPASNGLLDLFGQCYILDEGRTLGKFITKYRMDYFTPVDDNKFVWVPKPGAEQQIYERVAPLALRMAAEDYLEMPQLIINTIKMELPPDARVVYDQMWEDLITKIGDGTIMAQNAVVAMGKCRQIANGGIYLDPEVTAMGFKILRGKREWADLHEEKVDAIEDLVEELQGNPLLVAYDFGHELARLQKRFGKDVPYIGGGVTPKRSAELEKLWNQGRLPLLLGHPQSIGHGLNLQEQGHHVAFHALTHDYELYDQFIRRVLRQGNKSKKVFVHHLVMKDTIDEMIVAALKSKEKGQQAFFGALKALAKPSRKRLK